MRNGGKYKWRNDIELHEEERKERKKMTCHGCEMERRKRDEMEEDEEEGGRKDGIHSLIIVKVRKLRMPLVRSHKTGP